MSYLVTYTSCHISNVFIIGLPLPKRGIKINRQPKYKYNKRKQTYQYITHITYISHTIILFNTSSPSFSNLASSVDSLFFTFLWYIFLSVKTHLQLLQLNGYIFSLFLSRKFCLKYIPSLNDSKLLRLCSQSVPLHFSHNYTFQQIVTIFL